MTVKSPSRVDLAGGTLDLWPLFAVTGGASTINVAISVWTEVTIRETKGLICKTEDFKREWYFEDRKELLSRLLALNHARAEAEKAAAPLAKQKRGKGPPRGAIVYLLFCVFALASDVNELASDQPTTN